MSSTEHSREDAALAYDAVGQTVLYSYLSRAQEGQQWALLDNLSGDDLRDVARAAILLLREANAAIGIASVALDDMVPRKVRFTAREAALAMIGPYLDRLADRLGVDDSGRSARAVSPPE